ncbi:hypothetical protein L1987_16315 [Smallanthus sonchifolius]|uniref:Uncharacterized protein n=1 Tax=Smallanthus sonchifolius TaxID=185202 RepID=A0ACB9JBH3_9ASTR|nr:hypothetical protein L1987_16315 [Smallanthus sonchifolius]
MGNFNSSRYAKTHKRKLRVVILRLPRAFFECIVDSETERMPTAGLQALLFAYLINTPYLLHAYMISTQDFLLAYLVSTQDPLLAYLRFNTLLSRCPQHSLSDWALVEKFYNGLTFEKQQMFNTTAGGHIMERLEPDECEEMFESFAEAEQQHPHSVTNSIPTFKHPPLLLEVCIWGGHDTRDCPVNNQEHVSYAGNQFNGRQQQYGGGEAGASSGSSVNTRKIEEMLENQTQLLAHLVQQDKDMRQRLDSHDTLLKNQQSSFQDLQRTVGDIAQSLKGRQGGPSSGPNASVMVVSVRSVEKKEIAEDDSHSIEYGIPSVEEVKKVDWRARFAEIDARGETPPVVEEEEPVDEDIEMEKPAERVVEKKKGVEMKSPGVDLSRIPYPARVLPYKNTREYGTFLDMFKQLKFNLSFIEVLQQMPKYGKFLKYLLSKKKKLWGISEVSLSEQCSAVVQNKLLEKMADSGRFTIPCLFGGLHLNYALADLCSSINLMPYSVYKQLDLGELRPTHMSISLADRSVKYPGGIMENILVKVGKFVFPVDFVILDMEVDDKVPLNL